MTCADHATSAESVVATIASRMADLRRARELTLQDLADRTGFAKSHIWEIERGRSRNPTITTAVGIARALGVSLDYLTGFSTSEPALHPEAMRIACEVDAVLRRAASCDRSPKGQDACGLVHEGTVGLQAETPHQSPNAPTAPVEGESL